MTAMMIGWMTKTRMMTTMIDCLIMLFLKDGFLTFFVSQATPCKSELANRSSLPKLAVFLSSCYQSRNCYKMTDCIIIRQCTILQLANFQQHIIYTVKQQWSSGHQISKMYHTIVYLVFDFHSVLSS